MWRELAYYVREMLLSGESASRACIETGVVANMIDEPTSVRVNYQRQKFALLVFEIFHLIFIDGREH